MMRATHVWPIDCPADVAHVAGIEHRWLGTEIDVRSCQACEGGEEEGRVMHRCNEPKNIRLRLLL